jgi:hypothetical protein
MEVRREPRESLGGSLARQFAGLTIAPKVADFPIKKAHDMVKHRSSAVTKVRLSSWDVADGLVLAELLSTSVELLHIGMNASEQKGAKPMSTPQVTFSFSLQCEHLAVELRVREFLR